MSASITLPKSSWHTLSIIFLACVALPFLETSACAQNFGLPLWGRPYQNTSVNTPAPTPAAAYTPSEARLPIPIYAVNVGNTISKDMNSIQDQQPVTVSYDKRAQYLLRDPNSIASNYFFVTKAQGIKEPVSGAQEIITQTGMCSEDLAYSNTSRCSYSVANTQITESNTPSTTTLDYMNWTPAELTTRPYSCRVEQYFDSNGNRLNSPNTYLEENRTALFVTGPTSYRYKVRFDLQSTSITPQISALFASSNRYGLMSPSQSTPLSASQLRVENFQLLPGTANTFEGVVYGSSPYQIVVSNAPSTVTRGPRNATIVSRYSCGLFTISNPRVIQNLGD